MLRSVRTVLRSFASIKFSNPYKQCSTWSADDIVDRSDQDIVDQPISDDDISLEPEEPWTLDRKLADLKDRGYPSTVYEHPKAYIYSMETEMIEKLIELKSKASVQEASIKDLFQTSVDKYTLADLQPQEIADLLASFISSYGDEFVYSDILPLVPAAAKQIGLDSTLLLCLCLRPFTGITHRPPTSSEDEFITSTLDSIEAKSDFKELKQEQLISPIIYAAMAATSRWKEIIEESRSFIHPAAVLASLRHKEYDTTFKLLVPDNYNKSEFVFGSMGAGHHAIMRSIKHVTEEIPPQMMPRLVESLSQLDLEIDPECALKISKKWNSWLTSSKKHKKIAHTTSIDFGGECMKCKARLDTESITKEEVRRLQSVFYNQSIIDAGVYTLTDPTSISRFIHYIKDRPPYGLVIDGLNAFHNYHSHKNDFLTPQLTAQNFNSTIVQVNDILATTDNKRILIVTRKHGVKQIPEEILHISDVYAVDNKHADDVYTVYAALSSGPNCNMISGDYLRQHSKYIASQGHDMIYLFNKWQRLNQIPNIAGYMRNMPSKRRGVREFGSGARFSPALKTVLKTQKNGSCWHIPIANSTYYKLYTPRLPRMQDWLCLPI